MIRLWEVFETLTKWDCKLHMEIGYKSQKTFRGSIREPFRIRVRRAVMRLGCTVGTRAQVKHVVYLND